MAVAWLSLLLLFEGRASKATTLGGEGSVDPSEGCSLVMLVVIVDREGAVDVGH
jgi:hypothetical protein